MRLDTLVVGDYRNCMSTWIVLANKGGARILESTGIGRPLTTVEELPFPWARLKASELTTDKPGNVFESHGDGVRAKEPPTNPKEVLAERFAKMLADRLDKARQTNSYDRLVLIAEPQFLGALRNELPSTVAEKVAASVDKNLPDASDADVRRTLEDVISV